MVDSQLDFSFSSSRNAAQKNLKKIKKNQEVIEKWVWSVFLVFAQRNQDVPRYKVYILVGRHAAHAGGWESPRTQAKN